MAGDGVSHQPHAVASGYWEREGLVRGGVRELVVAHLVDLPFCGFSLNNLAPIPSLSGTELREYRREWQAGRAGSEAEGGGWLTVELECSNVQ